jgi:hypothetical protein
MNNREEESDINQNKNEDPISVSVPTNESLGEGEQREGEGEQREGEVEQREGEGEQREGEGEQREGEGEHEQENLLSTGFETGKKVLKLYFTFIASQVIKLSNYVLSALVDRLSGYLGNEGKEGSIGNDLGLITGYNDNRKLISTLNAIMDTPEFKEEWKKFTDNIVNLTQELVEQIKTVVDKDVQDIITNFTELLTGNIERITKGTGFALYTGVCAVPVIAPFCEAIDVASTGIQVGSNTFVKTLQIFDKFTEAFESIFGETAVPFAKTIEQVIEFKNYIVNVMDKLENLPEKGLSDVNRFIDKKQRELVSSVPSVPSVPQSGGKDKKRRNRSRSRSKSRSHKNKSKTSNKVSKKLHNRTKKKSNHSNKNKSRKSGKSRKSI